MKRLGISVFSLLLILVSLSGCSQSPQRLIAAGNKYHDKHKYKEASILYRKAITKDKTNAEAYYREALNLSDQGNLVEAAKFYRSAIDLKPDNADAAAKLSEIYLLIYSANPKRAQTLLPELRELDSKLLKQDAHSYAGLRLKAFLAIVDNRPSDALSSFAEANRVKPYSRDLVVWYAQTLAVANRFPEAERLVRDMIAHDKTWAQSYDFLFVQYLQRKQTEAAEAILRERMQNDPTNPIAYANLANYYMGTNRLAEGEAVIRQTLSRKDIPKAHKLVGDFYVRAKQLDKALAEYQAGESSDPKNKLAYQQAVVNVYTLEGKRDQAVQLARQLVKDNPKDTTSSQLYASLMLSSGSRSDVAKSLDELKSLVQKNGNDPILQYDLARAYAETGDADKSLSAVQEAVRLRPGLIPARLLAARLYQQRSQPSKALEQADAVLGVQANNPDARLARAQAFISLNQADRALPELEALVAQYPQANEAHFQLAGVYMGHNELAKAAEQYQKLADANPPDERGFIGLESIKLQQGKQDEAVAGMQRLVDKNPKRLDYRYILANFEAQAATDSFAKDPTRSKSLYEQAQDNYKAILKATNNPADVWLRLGMVQKQLGQNDAALASFAQASPQSRPNTVALLNRAMLLEAMGKNKEARDTYNQILGLDPDNAVALNNLAFLTAQSGDNLDQAMTLAERAKKKAPNNPNVSDTLGYVYYQKNLNSAALDIFQRAVQEDPKNALFRYHLAMALLKKGDREGAKREANSALAMAGPTDKEKIRSFANQI